MPVPLMDIRGQYADLLDDVKQAVCDVIDSGRFILGPNMRALEEEIASAVGAGHGVAVANGTDALVLSLEALGIGRGDEVITTAYTFYATAEAIARVGATPVFADIDPRTFNLDPAAAEAAVTERTRAIVAVHLFGQPADLPALRDVASRHGLALIEDAAQAFGATVDGRGAGSFGDLATFSFFPTKNFPAFGDAGMVVSGSADLAERVRLLRFHGSREKRRFELVGTNSRMDEIQAAVLRRFLPEVGGWNAGRRAVADRYRAARPRRPGRAPGRGAGRRARLPPLRRALARPRPARPHPDRGRDRLPRRTTTCRCTCSRCSRTSATAGATCPRPSARPTRAWRCRCSRRWTSPARREVVAAVRAAALAAA